jgi:hypothetical protein
MVVQRIFFRVKTVWQPSNAAIPCFGDDASLGRSLLGSSSIFQLSSIVAGLSNPTELANCGNLAPDGVSLPTAAYLEA